MVITSYLLIEQKQCPVSDLNPIFNKPLISLAFLECILRKGLGRRESSFTGKWAECEPDCTLKICRGTLRISVHLMVHLNFWRLQYTGLLLEELNRCAVDLAHLRY
jgi:hypothetical protein